MMNGESPFSKKVEAVGNIQRPRLKRVQVIGQPDCLRWKRSSSIPRRGIACRRLRSQNPPLKTHLMIYLCNHASRESDPLDPTTWSFGISRQTPSNAPMRSGLKVIRILIGIVRRSMSMTRRHQSPVIPRPTLQLNLQTGSPNPSRPLSVGLQPDAPRLCTQDHHLHSCLYRRSHPSWTLPRRALPNHHSAVSRKLLLHARLRNRGWLQDSYLRTVRNGAGQLT